MPLRISALCALLRPSSVSLTRLPAAPASHSQFSTTSAFLFKKQKRRRNPYAAARSLKVKKANIQRQEELKAARLANAADPVVGRPTPFLTSLETPPKTLPFTNEVPQCEISLETREELNYFLTPGEVNTFLSSTEKLLAPLSSGGGGGSVSDPYIDPEKIDKLNQDHNQASEAIRRIISLGNGSSADKTRFNKTVCISTFGRHVTDSKLPPDPTAHGHANKTPRAGPDTGSSEVQAAILTVKIRALAKILETEGKKDKVNKRNLRLMVHKRQKHLKYLKRKEKGGVRWRNIMENLGLDDDAIEKEIFM